tara:strand:+ start:12348 stop:12662 length:315 start_codon:yes stop_codon:yes gene_type:complete
MPKLNGKSYAYTKKGKEAYKEALIKKKKLKKIRKKVLISGAEWAGLVAGSTIAQKSAMKGKSQKEKRKILGKMIVGNLVTQGVVAGGKKIYNKVVDKVNKKRGY